MKCVLILLSVTLCVYARLSKDLKCSACENIISELQNNLDKEVEGKTIDLRGRLDSKGKRQGKVVDYKQSESRIEELLSPICNRMQRYSLYQLSDSDIEELHDEEWEDTVGSTEMGKKYESVSMGESKEDYMDKAVENYCDVFVEEQEDSLVSSIRKELTQQQMTAKYCKKLCKQKEQKLAKWEVAEKERKTARKAESKRIIDKYAKIRAEKEKEEEEAAAAEGLYDSVPSQPEETANKREL